MKAVFLDRDGTLIVDRGYLASPAQIEFLQGAISALSTFVSSGYRLVVVTNQSGIGRGYFTEEQAARVRDAFLEALSRNGLDSVSYYVCPHSPDAGCPCRKPEPGLFHRAQKELGLSLESSWTIGDKMSDVLAGKAAGTRTILFGRNAEAKASLDLAAESWPELVKAWRANP